MSFEGMCLEGSSRVHTWIYFIFRSLEKAIIVELAEYFRKNRLGYERGSFKDSFGMTTKTLTVEYF